MNSITSLFNSLRLNLLKYIFFIVFCHRVIYLMKLPLSCTSPSLHAFLSGSVVQTDGAHTIFQPSHPTWVGAAKLMQNTLCPSPGSNAVTHIATTSEHPFSFFVFLRSSRPLLCLCPFFLLYWQYQGPVSKHLSPPFTSPLFPYAARRNPFLKPVTVLAPETIQTKTGVA